MPLGGKSRSYSSDRCSSCVGNARFIASRSVVGGADFVGRGCSCGVPAGARVTCTDRLFRQAGASLRPSCRAACSGLRGWGFAQHAGESTPDLGAAPAAACVRVGRATIDLKSIGPIRPLARHRPGARWRPVGAVAAATPPAEPASHSCPSGLCVELDPGSSSSSRCPQCARPGVVNWPRTGTLRREILFKSRPQVLRPEVVACVGDARRPAVAKLDDDLDPSVGVDNGTSCAERHSSGVSPFYTTEDTPAASCQQGTDSHRST